MNATPENEKKPLPASVIAQYTLVVLVILAAALFLWEIKEAILAAFGGVIIAVVLTGFARVLRRFLPLSRAWSLVTVGILIIAVISLFVVIFGPQISEEFDELTERLPRQLNELQEQILGMPMGEELLDGRTVDFDQMMDENGNADGEQEEPEDDEMQETHDSDGGDAGEDQANEGGIDNGEEENNVSLQADNGEAEEEEEQEEPEEESEDEMEQVGGVLFQAGSALVDILSVLIVVFFTGIFFSADPNLYRSSILLLVTKNREKRVGEALDTTSYALWLWLTGQFIAMLFVGTSIAVALTLIDIPLALILGVIAGLFDFVPYVGPIVAFFPALLIALSVGPEAALMTAAVYLAIQQLEGHVLTPLVQRYKVYIPPAMVILSIVAFGLAFGVPGVILATPLAVVLMVMVGMLYVQDVLGKDITVPGETKIPDENDNSEQDDT